MMGSGRAAKGQKVSQEAHQMAADLLPLLDTWPGRSDHERAAALVDAIVDRLLLTGLPTRPRSATAIGGVNSRFTVTKWTIEIGHPALRMDNPSLADFAMVCEHARHEVEHALMDFRRIRLEARSGEDAATLAGRLGIDEAIAERAIQVNADGRYEVIKGTDLEAQAIEFTASLANPDRERVLATMRKANELLTKAERAAREAGPRPKVDPETGRPAYEAKLTAAEQAYEKALKEYMALPDEVLAWRAGQEMQLAVQHAGLQRRIAQATDRLTAANNALAGAAEGNRERLQREFDDARRAFDELDHERRDLLGEAAP
jgi:hypothetical protein